MVFDARRDALLGAQLKEAEERAAYAHPKAKFPREFADIGAIIYSVAMTIFWVAHEFRIHLFFCLILGLITSWISSYYIQNEEWKSYGKIHMTILNQIYARDELTDSDKSV